MKPICILLLSNLLITAMAIIAAPARTIELWPEGVPDLKPDATPEKIVNGRTSNIHHPSFLMFPPDPAKATGTAVVLCSGGGYVRISVNPNGDSSTRLLNDLGITVFSLKYRLSDYGHPAPLQDVLRALRMVRSRAAEFGVDPGRIGVMGTSAGGHLSACAATLWDSPEGKTTATLDRISARPDFAVLIYPVISMSAPFTHVGSRNALLGNNPSQALKDALSVEKHVRKDGPPVFLIATMADKVVPVGNTLSFYQALLDAGIPAEMHVYAQGDHANSLDPLYGPTAAWPRRMEEWMRFHHWLEPQTVRK